MKALSAISFALLCPLAWAQPILLDPEATLFAGNDQLVVTGEIIYQGRRAPRRDMAVLVEAPRGAGVATFLASAPAEIGVFALAPSPELGLEPGSVVTVSVIESERVAAAEHVRVTLPESPARPASPPSETVATEAPPEPPLDRRAGGMYIGYRMHSRAPSSSAAYAGSRTGGSLNVSLDVTAGGGNFDFSTGF